MSGIDIASGAVAPSGGRAGRSDRMSQQVLNVAVLLQRLAMVALIGLAAVTVLDVVGRSTTGFTVRGIYEINGLIMAVIVAAAVAPAFLLRKNVMMDFLARHMGARGVLNAFASAGGTVLLVLLAWQLFAKAEEAVEFSETTSLLVWPIAPFWYAAAGGLFFAAATAGLFTLIAVRDAVRADEPGKAKAVLSLIGSLGLAGAILWGLTAGDVSRGWQAVAAFFVLYLLVSVNLPIAVGLGLVGFAFLGVLIGDIQAFAILQNQASQAMTSTDLAAIPLFLLMGNLAVQAGLSNDIFRAAASLTSNMRGGLAVSSIAGCGAFGAICGSSLATTATFGKVAFDEMDRRGYSRRLATGSLAAGGTLGALIPPSVVLIIYCVLVEVSIQEAFIACLIPALLATALYLLAVKVQVWLNPSLAPDAEPIDKGQALRHLVAAWRPILLFLLVLGGLYGGIFTTQEAAAVGAFLSLVFAVTSGQFSWKAFASCLDDTALNSVVIYAIIIGANTFAGFLSLSDITGTILSVVDLETTPHWLILIVIMIMYLIMGSVFDTVAAVLVTAPFVIPLIDGMGYDLIWWGIITLSLIEIGMITPPVGMNVFVMNSVIGNAVKLKTIFRGVVPFLCADLFRVVLLVLFPIITLWLPEVLK